MRNNHSKAVRLIVVSVDGMPPDSYRRAGELGLKIPNLLSMVESGSSADAVESIYPTTTYPAHATLVTGVPPRDHGIYSHLASLDPTSKARAWHWFAQPIRVPAIWNATRATGRKTAAVGWPVSAGAPIDYNIPEIWDPACPDPLQDLSTVARHSTPGLLEEVTKALQPIPSSASADHLRAEAALHLWRKCRPDLLLLHLVGYDQQAHRHGPLSSQAFSALEENDKQIGRMCEAIAGREPVELVVVSDHGFVPVEKEAAPLVVVTQEGLLGRTSEGQPELRQLGAVHAGGSFAVYWLEPPSAEERRSLDRTLERLRETGTVAEIMDRDRLRSLAADPDAEFILDASPGVYFSDRWEGPVVRPTVKDRGTHGHLPTRPGLEASFIAAGPGIARGKNLGHVRLTQVAATLMHLLDLPSETLAANEQPLDLG